MNLSAILLKETESEQKSFKLTVCKGLSGYEQCFAGLRSWKSVSSQTAVAPSRRKFLGPSYFVTALVVMLLHTSVLDSYLAPLFEFFKLGADKNQNKHGGKTYTFHEI